MAAPTGKMVGVSDESSSEDDEDIEKLKEAVWTTQGAKKTDGESNWKQSRRVTVSKHEHDGNELQVTPEFRAHVAKKLGHLLDSFISEIPAETPSCAGSAKCDGGDDEGFRLFRTSIPGHQVDDTPPPVRRRPIPSSSDSDSEMEARLREAAVSITDLLPPSSLPSALSSSSTEPPRAENKKREENTQEQGEGEEIPVRKKKKKKKKPPQGESEEVTRELEKRQDKEEEETLLPKKKKKRKFHPEESGEQVRGLDSEGSASNARSNRGPGNPEEVNVPLKVKRKKKHKVTGQNEEQGGLD